MKTKLQMYEVVIYVEHNTYISHERELDALLAAARAAVSFPTYLAQFDSILTDIVIESWQAIAELNIYSHN